MEIKKFKHSAGFPPVGFTTMLTTMGTSEKAEPLEYSAEPRRTREALIVEFDDRTEIHLPTPSIAPALVAFGCMASGIAAACWSVVVRAGGGPLRVPWYAAIWPIAFCFVIAGAARVIWLTFGRRTALTVNAKGLGVRWRSPTYSGDLWVDWSEVTTINAVAGPMLASLRRDNRLDVELAGGDELGLMHRRPIAEIERVAEVLVRWRLVGVGESPVA